MDTFTVDRALRKTENAEIEALRTESGSVNTYLLLVEGSFILDSKEGQRHEEGKFVSAILGAIGQWFSSIHVVNVNLELDLITKDSRLLLISSFFRDSDRFESGPIVIRRALKATCQRQGETVLGNIDIRSLRESECTSNMCCGFVGWKCVSK